jgi:hypothetical protein
MEACQAAKSQVPNPKFQGPNSNVPGSALEFGNLNLGFTLGCGPKMIPEAHPWQ